MKLYSAITQLWQKSGTYFINDPGQDNYGSQVQFLSVISNEFIRTTSLFGYSFGTSQLSLYKAKGSAECVVKNNLVLLIFFLLLNGGRSVSEIESPESMITCSRFCGADLVFIAELTQSSRFDSELLIASAISGELYRLKNGSFSYGFDTPPAGIKSLIETFDSFLSVCWMRT